MAQVIVYNDVAGVAVLVPETRELQAVDGDILKLGRSEVPAGKKFAVIDASTIPTDRTFRSSWVIDAALLTDGVGE